LVLPVDLGRADPFSLKIGRFWERSPQRLHGSLRARGITSPHVFAHAFSRLTAGVHLAGAVVSFDEERLRRLLRTNGACPDWSHRVICVEALAVGRLRLPVPVGLAETAVLLGLEVDESVLHTALGDVRLAKAVWTAVMGPGE
jgi:hypothetical protein